MKWLYKPLSTAFPIWTSPNNPLAILQEYHTCIYIILKQIVPCPASTSYIIIMYVEETEPMNEANHDGYFHLGTIYNEEMVGP